MLSPLYGQLSPLRVPTRVAGRELADADAIAYIAAVESADAQTLEDGVKFAYEDFIVGCKSDGIWSAIKASCILAGARTLSGALVPLVGTAPTNLNFVSADYNRETGLKANGSTKRLLSNRNNADDPQNSMHMSCFITQWTGSYVMGVGNGALVGSTHFIDGRVRNRNKDLDGSAASVTSFLGSSRASSTHTIRRAGISTNYTRISQAPYSANHTIFAVGLADGSTFANNAGRLSYYSIGESIDLAALDARVSTLMTDLAAAI